MILLGIGSNLSSSFGDRFQNIDLAVSALEGYGIQLKKKSSYYESLSYPNKKNPKFINIVIEIETHLPPEDLASVLIFIEEYLERKRKKTNAIKRFFILFLGTVFAPTIFIVLSNKACVLYHFNNAIFVWAFLFS